MAGLKKAYLEITNVCNLRCEFCPGTRRKQGFLSPEGFEVLAGKLRPYVDYIYLHLMGEPLLHPQLSQLLEIAGELGFKVIITTNGTLLPRQVELLAQSSAVHKISISLHSFEGNESHDTDLSHYLENTISAVQKLSVAGKICALRLWNLDGETTRGANADNDAILAKLEQTFPKPWKDNPRGATLAGKVYLEWGEKFDWPDIDGEELGQDHTCYGLRDQIGVLSNGTVVPCCLDADGSIPLGNIFESDLSDILSGERAQALKTSLERRRVTEALCVRCGYARKKKY